MDLYAVTCHAPGDHPLRSARCLDQRVDLVESVLASLCDDTPALVVFPAGFFRATSVAQRDGLAASMLDKARDSALALLFGVDVAPEGGWRTFPAAPQCYAYLCDGAKRLLWPAPRVLPREAKALPPNRRVTLGDLRLGVLLESEIFSRGLRESIAAPDLCVVLSHGGMTERWRPALTALDRQCPVLVIGQTFDARARLELFGPRGFERALHTNGAEVTVQRYRPVGPVDSEVRVPRSA
jgi:hypothetical protein